MLWWKKLKKKINKNFVNIFLIGKVLDIEFRYNYNLNLVLLNFLNGCNYMWCNYFNIFWNIYILFV